MMKRQDPNKRIQWIILLIFSPFFFVISIGETEETPYPYSPLMDRLIQDGFDPEFLSKILMDARADLNLFILVNYLNLRSRESPELYSKFLTRESILLSKKFLHENRRPLRIAEKRFQVEKEVIVAILLVESRFGENIGKYRVIPTLASIAMMDSPEHLQNNFQTLRENDPYLNLTYEWVEDFAKKKAQWAYHELRCFLKIIREEALDPLEVYGSYAGALGMPQFIPSSYLHYAVSKKGFTHWLLNKDEAIYSIGNYLRSHGWRKNLSMKKKEQILWTYNHSEPYIKAILQVANRIREK